MDNGDIQQFTGKRTDLVTSLIDRLGKNVADNQKQLLSVVVDDFLDKLDTKNGIIQNSLKNKRLLTLLDQVFNRYGSTNGLETIKTIIDGVTQIVNFNDNYFTALAGNTVVAPIKAEAAALINSWLGITSDGKITPNGYLDTLVKDPQVKNQIRAIILKNIVSQSGYNATKQDLKDYITGTDEKTGALESYYRNFVYDTYSQIDRANAQVYADKLNLEHAIYEGGIIKTTRPFCRERNGKVFTREEIAAFDPPTAKPPGYNPFTDLGGYGCRHHLNWIPNAVALALRPDLKGEEPKVEPAPPPVKEPAKQPGKSADAKPFDKIKNVNEFKAEVSDIIQHWTGITPGAVSASFASLPKEKAIRFGNQISDLLDEYKPFEGMQKIDKINFKSTKRASGFISQYPGGKQIVEANFGNNIEGSKQRIFDPEGKAMRYFSRVDDENLDIATVTHEFAHFITVGSQVNNSSDITDPRIRPFWEDLNALRYNYQKELAAIYDKNNNDVAFNNFNLGKYAGTNSNEFMAEAFTEYKLSSQPSKYAVLVGELIDKYFSR